MSAARPWLRSLRRRGGDLGVGGDDHPALPRGHLLVGVEGEGGEVAAGADLAPLGVDRAERLAGVLEDAEAVLGGERLQLGHRRRVAEDVDRQDAGRALADRGRGGCGVEVERHRVDVAEDRPRALVEQAVGGGDEAEGAGQDLVAGAPAERPHPEVQRRSCRWRRRPRPRPRASRRNRARSARPSAPARAARAQHLEHELLLARADLGPGERDRFGSAAVHGGDPTRRSPRAGRRTPASRPAPPRRPR